MHLATIDLLIGDRAYRPGDELPALPPKRLAALVKSGAAIAAAAEPAAIETADAPPADPVETADAAPRPPRRPPKR